MRISDWSSDVCSSDLDGKGRNMTGAAAPTLVIRVPAGTQVLSEDKETVLADLTEVGQRLVFLKGGDGGFGNTRFKSSTNQAPRRADPGDRKSTRLNSSH